MADRTSIDIEGLRHRIEDVRSDIEWQELSLTKKVRVLVIKGLEAMEKERGKDQEEKK